MFWKFGTFGEFCKCHDFGSLIYAEVLQQTQEKTTSLVKTYYVRKYLILTSKAVGNLKFGEFEILNFEMMKL